MVDINELNDVSSIGSRSAAEGLSPKQKVWADEYIANGWWAAAAAKVAYPNDTYWSQRVIGVNNKKNERVKAYLDEKGMDAGLFLEKVMNNSLGEEIKMPERLKAGIFIYEQSVGKARQRIEVTGKDGDAIETVNFSGMSAIELDKIRKELLGSK